MKPSLEIGLLGGSFDPVHLGHLGVARAAADALGLNEVWLIPAAQAPLRNNIPSASGPDRLAMLRLAVAALGDDRLHACDLEITRGGLSYTAETLRTLHTLHPGRSFIWILGEDQFSRLASWREPATLAALADWAVYARPGFPPAPPPAIPGLRWRRIPSTQTWNLSSSEIRARLATGQIPCDAIPDKVIEYIRKNGLYAARAH